METCKICQKQFDRLASHVNRSHGMEYREYLLQHELGGVPPKCKCGCGQDTPFSRSQGMRFLVYIHGHSARAEGRLTEESKQRIGSKNRENAQQRFEANPGVLLERATQMRKHVTPEVRQCSAKTNSENWRKPESAEKRRLQSSRACDLLEQGKIGPQAPYKTEWKLNPFTGREEYMHSSWETRFLDECVEKGVPVTKQHGIRIPYTDPNGLERTYIPDFLALDGRTLYEVKGYESETDRTKWRATMAWCLENDATHEVVQYDRATT
jgi:hypothetical protein